MLTLRSEVWLIVAGVCAYEAVALCWQQRLPTVTKIARRYMIARVIVLGGLALHFRRGR